jgi:hypothetical protein
MGEPAGMTRAPGALAVALHDIEPSTYDHCALIRDWLSDHGVERVTLVVIPARDLRPLSDRRAEMADWLHECALRGDAIAQDGFRHLPSGRVTALARLRRGEAELAGLGRDDPRRARARTAGRTLCLDLHPSDLASTRRMLALESVLRRSAGRRAVTYDELAAGAARG